MLSGFESIIFVFGSIRIAFNNKFQLNCMLYYQMLKLFRTLYKLDSFYFKLSFFIFINLTFIMS